VSAEKQENTGMGPTSAALAAVLCKPHPEEARSAVPKDEASDPFALMLRDASQRGSAVEGSAPLSRCDAPQHEGRRALRILAKRTQLQILAKRTQRSFRPNEAKRECACLVGAKDNLPLYGMTAGCVPLFPDCYLQWVLQLARVGL
jgi:hypothetical protein